jgi:ADP-ribosylglycohydrolase
VLESHAQNRRDRLARAYQSLQGLCCGDAFGERFFIPEERARSLIDQKALPAPPWIFTDDTMMAISIVATLEEREEIDQNHLATSFARNYDPTRGYGPAMHGLLASIRQRGGHWREEAQALFGGQGSFGNGSAMRVAPLGAYFADDLDMVVEHAERSAVTTHCHPEAVAGAIAVALATALTWQHRNSPQAPAFQELLQQVYQRTPASDVRRGIQRAIFHRSATPARAASRTRRNRQSPAGFSAPRFAVAFPRRGRMLPLHTRHRAGRVDCARAVLQSDAWDLRRCGHGNRGRSSRMPVGGASVGQRRKHFANRTGLRHGTSELNSRTCFWNRRAGLGERVHLRQRQPSRRVEPLSHFKSSDEFGAPFPSIFLLGGTGAPPGKDGCS